MTRTKLFVMFTLVCSLLLFPLSYAGDKIQSDLLLGVTVSSGEEKTLTLFINNSDSTSHDYKLSVDGFSNTLETYFTSDGQVLDTVTVSRGKKLLVVLNILVKGDVLVNEDQGFVKLTRDDGVVQTLSIPMMVQKEYDLALKSLTNSVDCVSGTSADFIFLIENNGSKTLTDLRMIPELPNKWYSNGGNGFMTLKPGEVKTVTVKVDVPSSQTSGNYNVNFKASSGQITSGQVRIPVIVKANFHVGYIMLLILAGIGIFTFTQFKKHGRR